MYMNNNDLWELDDLIINDSSIDNDLFRMYSRMIRISNIFNESFDGPEHFENASFGGSRRITIDDNERINMVLSDIYGVLEEKNMIDDYDLLLEEMIIKLNNGDIDIKTAKLQLLSIGCKIGYLPTFYSVYDEYLKVLLQKEREKERKVNL